MIAAIITSLPSHIWDTLIIFLPAYLANMSPVIFLKTGFLKKLRSPVDMKAMLLGERLLGDNKTFYGIITAIMGGALGITLSLLIYSWSYGETITDVLTECADELIYSWSYGETITFGNDTVAQYLLLAFTGAWIGLGAICGDMLKSFFKRRLKITPGKCWLFFDQVDFVIGAWIAMMIMKLPVSTIYFIIALIITPLLHLGTNVIAYKLKLKKVWW